MRLSGELRFTAVRNDSVGFRVFGSTTGLPRTPIGLETMRCPRCGLPNTDDGCGDGVGSCGCNGPIGTIRDEKDEGREMTGLDPIEVVLTIEHPLGAERYEMIVPFETKHGVVIGMSQVFSAALGAHKQKIDRAADEAAGLMKFAQALLPKPQGTESALMQDLKASDGPPLSEGRSWKAEAERLQRYGHAIKEKADRQLKELERELEVTKRALIAVVYQEGSDAPAGPGKYVKQLFVTAKTMTEMPTEMESMTYPVIGGVLLRVPGN